LPFERSEAIDQIASALVKAQAKVEGAAKDSENPHLHNMYADLGSVWDACKAALSENGLAVAQLPDALGEKPYLRTVLTHESGQWMASTTPLEYSDDERGRTKMQSLGSAITYARRYALMAIVGVCPEDDDGNGAGAGADRRPAQRRPENGPPARREPDRRPQSDDRGNAGARREGDGNATGRRHDEDAAPRTGKALFAWTRKQDERHNAGLLDHLNGWGKKKRFPGRMVDWSDEEVSEGHAEAIGYLESLQSADADPSNN
jgi:hypothetical protein